MLERQLDTCQSPSPRRGRASIKDTEMQFADGVSAVWSYFEVYGRRNLVNSGEVRDACMHFKIRRADFIDGTARFHLKAATAKVTRLPSGLRKESGEANIHFP